MADEERITVETDPYNAETPLPALAGGITPDAAFYVRNHFAFPTIDPAAWRLVVEGLVSRPLELTLDDVQSLPPRTLTLTLECAGNGRVALDPRPAGTPWGWGATGTAQFTGTPLAGLLDQAGLAANAIELLFCGADSGEAAPGRTINFCRSLPRSVAMLPDVLLAWDMNGHPLAPEHGAPLRLVVPGWYGMASVKWLTRIAALAQPYAGYFQRERYVYTHETGTPDGTPVRNMRVRAVIAEPAAGATVGPGAVTVRGSAWAGGSTVARVELSADGGRSWQAAELAAATSPYAAVAWHAEWRPPGPGAHTLLARATDAAGNAQPLSPRWNEYGYGNNVVQRVPVTVAG